MHTKPTDVTRRFAGAFAPEASWWPARLAALFLFATAGFVLAGCGSQNQEASEQDAAEGAAVDSLALTEVWRLESGLDRPESAIYDPARDVIYVSNLVGGGDEMDGAGYIARVSPEGEMVDQDWVTGLNAPKGLAIGSERLYAADIDALLEIDLDTGEIVEWHQVEGDAYLNDVTVGSDGTVYVSDSRYSKVYRLDDQGLSVWLEHENVLMPNGVHVVDGDLYIAAGDSSAENPGQARYLQAVSLSDQSVRPLRDRTPEGALDAVEPDGAGGLFVTDWGGGRLLHFDPATGLTQLRQLGQGAADAEYVAETGMLYVPVMMEGQLIAYQVEM